MNALSGNIIVSTYSLEKIRYYPYFLGRLGLKMAKNEVSYFTEFDELRKKIDNKNLEISDVHVINENLGMVVASKTSTNDDESLLNLVMICQITSYARVLLYEAIHKAHTAGSTVLYCDTGVKISYSNFFCHIFYLYICR